MTQGKFGTGARRAASGCRPGIGGTPTRRAVRALAALPALAAALGGCITVNAPEEPIVIELNVNIRQEVIYRLAEDAGNTIDQNADIF